jgi:aspartate beta-hydroxylase
MTSEKVPVDRKTPLSIAQAQELAARGVSCLNQGRVAEAREALTVLKNSDFATADVFWALAEAERALGNVDDALANADSALLLEPRHLCALVLKGDLLQLKGLAEAASCYQAAIKCRDLLDELPAHWAPALARAEAMCKAYAKEFEAHLRGHLATLVSRHGPPSARFEHAVDLLTTRRQLFPSQPRLFFFPELPTVQFFDTTEFAWLKAVEAATPLIKQEMLALLSDAHTFSPYVQSDPLRPALRRGGLMDNPAWGACFLWKNGQYVAENGDRCPATLAALSSAPTVSIPGRSPSVLFSLLQPGAHIPSHHGFVNNRLIVHLPLLVPEKCSFRVGNETRQWVEGQALVFDDTIEHEAWNESESPRVILLFEIWRPELTAPEKAYVGALFESIEKQQTGIRDWGI